MDNQGSSGLITEEQLKVWLGYTRRGDIINKLRECKIGYHLGLGGRIATTQAAIDASLIGEKKKKPPSFRF